MEQKQIGLSQPKKDSRGILGPHKISAIALAPCFGPGRRFGPRGTHRLCGYGKGEGPGGGVSPGPGSNFGRRIRIGKVQPGARRKLRFVRGKGSTSFGMRFWATDSPGTAINRKNFRSTL